MQASVILQQRVTPETQDAFVIPCFYVTFSNLCSGKRDQTPADKKQKASQLMSESFYPSPSLSLTPSPLSPPSPDNYSYLYHHLKCCQMEKDGALYNFSEVKRKGKRGNCQMKASIDAFKCSPVWLVLFILSSV